MNTTIDSLERDDKISVRLHNVLWNNKIENIGQLARFTRAEFADFRHVGVKLLREADTLLKDHGLGWGLLSPIPDDKPDLLTRARTCDSASAWVVARECADALESQAAEIAQLQDRPDLDATDGAHPAWQRGYEYGIATSAKEVARLKAAVEASKAAGMAEAYRAVRGANWEVSLPPALDTEYHELAHESTATWAWVMGKQAQINRLENAARSRLKCPEGHSPGELRSACWFCDAERNARDLAALRAQPGEVAIPDHDCECPHGTPSRMVLITACEQCRGG